MPANYIIRFEDAASDGSAAWLSTSLKDDWTPLNTTLTRDMAVNLTLEDAAAQQRLLAVRGARTFIELL
jgi:hypothetical protein